MINVKEAARIARNYIVDIYGEENLPGLKLEETNLSEDESHWLITLGYETDRKSIPDASFFRPTPVYIRDYKVIKVDAATGKVESMNIREI